MAISIKNTSQHKDLDALNIPCRPDGQRYLYEMICDNGWSRVYDDLAAGLLGHFIEDYENLSEQNKLEARIKHAYDIQVITQARLLTFYSSEDITQEEKEVLLAPRHVQPAIESWACPIPLILIDSYYFPYSQTPRPYSEIDDVAMPSNIWWLKPSASDLEYLKSLNDFSIIDINVAKDWLP